MILKKYIFFVGYWNYSSSSHPNIKIIFFYEFVCKFCLAGLDLPTGTKNRRKATVKIQRNLLRHKTGYSRDRLGYKNPNGIILEGKKKEFSQIKKPLNKEMGDMRDYSD